MKRKISYLKALVIVHGKSEKQMSKFIIQELRLPMTIESNHNGANPIQITSVMNVLNNTKMKNVRAFIKNYPRVEWDFKNKKIAEDFKIFIIMDTEDCTEKQRQDYINKEMFKGHWAYDYIVPIYNTPNLESVLSKSGIPFRKSGDERKTEYIKIFPTDGNVSKSDIIQISDFAKMLSKCKTTNLEEFPNFCLSCTNNEEDNKNFTNS